MIFINYRKKDTQAIVDHLAFRLKERFGDAEVFKDDHDLQAGERWPDRLSEELIRRQVLVALIGPQWSFALDRNGQRRLDDPEDWVRRELCTALEMGKCVIVLLVDGTSMPGIDELPDSPLRKLPELQALPLRSGLDFESDLSRLLERLTQILEVCSSESRAQLLRGKNEPRTAPASNLPVSATSFVGRERELSELAILLSEKANAPFITLCGPPGTGKTRLATEIGRRLLSNYPGGCWFADLAEARTGAEISQAVAQAFGVPLTGKTTPVDGVASFLEYREPLLLILDNFEQVVEHASATISVWRRKAPQICFLITSRSLLGLADEREYNLDPLPAPAGRFTAMNVTEVESFESVRLFVDRARQVRPGFALDEKNSRVVGEICARLDGIPLAIELAAARVRVLQLPQLLERLGQRFELLRSSRRDVHRRHQTLLAAIEWSFDLLEPWEREAFLQMSIFRGGFFLEAVEAIVDLSTFSDAVPVMDVVQGLCEKGLLKAEDSVCGTRFRLLVSLREYGESRGDQEWTSSKRDLLWKRFGEFYVGYGERWNACIHGPHAREALDRLQAELDNCFEAHAQALQSGNAEIAVRLILAFGETLSRRGPIQERLPRLEACLTALDQSQSRLVVELKLSLVQTLDDIGEWEHGIQIATETVEQAMALRLNTLLAKVLIARAHMLSGRGDYPQAIEEFLTAEAMLRESGDSLALCRCLVWLAWAYAEIHEVAKAQECSTRAEVSARATGDRIMLASVVNNRGVFHNLQNQLPQALQCLKSAEAIDQEIGDRRASAMPLSNRGDVLRRQGKWIDAIACFDEAERINREFGNHSMLAANLHNRGMCRAAMGISLAAIPEYRAAEALNRKIGNRPWLFLNLNYCGVAYIDVEEFDQAIRCLQEAEAINATIENLRCRGYPIGNRGRLLARLGDYQTGIRCLTEAERINRNYGDLDELAENLGNRGRILFEMGDPAQGREVLRECLHHYDGLSYTSLYRFEFSVILASVEATLGNPTEASRLARGAMGIAEEFHLTDEHPAKWFVRLLPIARKLLTSD